MSFGAENWRWFACTAALLAVLPVAGWSETLTPAENAALAERALTAEEQQARNTECRLPDPEGSIVLFERELTTVRLPEMPILRLVEFGAPYFSDGEQSHIYVYPPLANGGLGYRDNCDPVAIAGDDGAVDIALLIRPTIDVALEYPSWHGTAKNQDQLSNVGGSLFAVVAARYEDELAAAADLVRLSDAARKIDAVDGDRPLIWTRGAFFIPVVEHSK